jgi:uncharacterized protein
MDAVGYSITFAAIAFVAFVLLKHFDKRLTWTLGVLFAVYVGLDDLVTGLPPEVPELRPFTTRWNWWGKSYSVLLSIVVILAFALNTKAVGLTLPKRNVRVGLAALIVLILSSVIVGFVVDPDPPTASTLAFQALMPGLAEELTYRGIAPALLLNLMRGRNPPEGVPWIVVCIAAVPYGVAHGLGYNGDTFSFALGPAFYTLTGGIIYGWLRFYTGSLLFPFLAHSLGNATFHLMALVP